MLLQAEVRGAFNGDGCSKFIGIMSQVTDNGNVHLQYNMELNMLSGVKYCYSYNNGVDTYFTEINFDFVGKAVNFVYYDAIYDVYDTIRNFNETYDKKTFSGHCPGGTSDYTRDCKGAGFEQGIHCKYSTATDIPSVFKDGNCEVCAVHEYEFKATGCRAFSWFTEPAQKIDWFKAKLYNLYKTEGKAQDVLYGHVNVYDSTGSNLVLTYNFSGVPMQVLAPQPLGMGGSILNDIVFDNQDLPEVYAFYKNNSMETAAARATIENIRVIPTEDIGVENDNLDSIGWFHGVPATMDWHNWASSLKDDFKFIQMHNPAKIERSRAYKNLVPYHDVTYGLNQYFGGVNSFANVNTFQGIKNATGKVSFSTSFSGLTVLANSIWGPPASIQIISSKCNDRTPDVVDTSCTMVVTSSKQTTSYVVLDLDNSLITAIELQQGTNNYNIIINSNFFVEEEISISLRDENSQVIATKVKSTMQKLPDSPVDTPDDPGTEANGDDPKAVASTWMWIVLAVVLSLIVVAILIYIFRSKLSGIGEKMKKSMEKRKYKKMMYDMKDEKELEELRNSVKGNETKIFIPDEEIPTKRNNW